MKGEFVFVVLSAMIFVSGVGGTQQIVTATSDVVPREHSDGVVVKNMTSDRGMHYQIKFFEHNLSLVIVGKNVEGRSTRGGIGVEVDGSRLVDYSFKISKNSIRKMQTQLNSSIRVISTKHAVTVSTYGSVVSFNWTENYSADNSIPTPYIKNVTIKDGTINGEPSAVAEVTVANPSKQTYPTKLMVHTTDTHGSFYPAAVPPGETRTITVELLDERGSKVAGEARLYTEALDKRKGAMDQVEFVGRAGEGTRHHNTSYQPVRPPWEDDSYRYRNRSVSGGPLPTDGTTLLYVAFGAALVVWLARKVG